MPVAVVDRVAPAQLSLALGARHVQQRSRSACRQRALDVVAGELAGPRAARRRLGGAGDQLGDPALEWQPQEQPTEPEEAATRVVVKAAIAGKVKPVARLLGSDGTTWPY